MATYRINVADRQYKEYEIVDSSTSIPAEGLHVGPVQSKLFNQDIFTLEKGIVTIVHSIYSGNAEVFRQYWRLKTIKHLEKRKKDEPCIVVSPMIDAFLNSSFLIL